ncbi:glycoside hydrolase superfamily [Dichotomocladium elegans]|nr:glycoside hydrolase superfamily [Dichotomocladium elegans]
MLFFSFQKPAMTCFCWLIITFIFTLPAHCHDAHNYQMIYGIPENENTGDSILRRHNHVEDPHIKRFKGETLAYVTPWNNRGYDVVKKFKGKFDYVSPVWFYIEAGPEPFHLFGEHDVDTNWIEQVRGDVDETGVPVTGKVVPRFQFRHWVLEDYQKFASQPEEGVLLIALLMDQIRKYGFDGLVLECGYPTFYPRFIKQLGRVLHQEKKVFIVVLPPLRIPDQAKFLNAESFAVLAQAVDRFSIMTYDYSSHLPTGGPTAPIDWLIDNIEALTDDDNSQQLLLGISLYAMSYKETRMPEARVCSSLLQTMRGKELVWDKESEEHWFKDDDQSTIWMPTLKSIRQRVHLAEDYEVGISLWEVGQGLDYFYELL